MMITKHLKCLCSGMILLLIAGIAMPVEAANIRGSARTSVNKSNVKRDVNKSRNVNRGNVNRKNVNRENINHNSNRVNVNNKNININNNHNVIVTDRGHYREHGDWYDDDDFHPIAAAAAVTATAIVVGSIVSNIPSNCVPVSYNGLTYQQCGSTWYQPQYVGTQVQYIVINPPY